MSTLSNALGHLAAEAEISVRDTDPHLVAVASAGLETSSVDLPKTADADGPIPRAAQAAIVGALADPEAPHVVSSWTPDMSKPALAAMLASLLWDHHDMRTSSEAEQIAFLDQFSRTALLTYCAKTGQEPDMAPGNSDQVHKVHRFDEMSAEFAQDVRDAFGEGTKTFSCVIWDETDQAQDGLRSYMTIPVGISREELLDAIVNTVATAMYQKQIDAKDAKWVLGQAASRINQLTKKRKRR